MNERSEKFLSVILLEVFLGKRWIILDFAHIRHRHDSLITFVWGDTSLFLLGQTGAISQERPSKQISGQTTVMLVTIKEGAQAVDEGE
jgi:hypothetical protein